ncbi:hypothetical protein BQ8482_130052 [Mesorhizobium delmotii]|uniref:Uncharacterized protein n=1 Tax=Mesorhizobium delmotii TaxID=1631247 RepID=A0A2P9AG82_9HYPH|nr:hypothetical protein BQ8482_130052 [Mesorhizobium delmotii]
MSSALARIRIEPSRHEGIDPCSMMSSKLGGTTIGTADCGCATRPTVSSGSSTGPGRYAGGVAGGLLRCHDRLPDVCRHAAGSVPAECRGGHGQGIDLKVRAHPTDRLGITAGLGLNRTTFTEYENPVTSGVDHTAGGSSKRRFGRLGFAGARTTG